MPLQIFNLNDEVALKLEIFNMMKSLNTQLIPGWEFLSGVWNQKMIFYAPECFLLSFSGWTLSIFGTPG